MTKQDIISIVVTSVFGFLLGIYIYVVGFAPTYRLPDTDTNKSYKDLVIVFDSYGECEDNQTCLTFQLRGDGAYRALLSGDGATAREGKISWSLYRRLNNITAEALTDQQLPLEEAICYYDEAGTNFRMLITYQGTNYILDTCETSIDYEGQVWQLLRDLYGEVAKRY